LEEFGKVEGKRELRVLSEVEGKLSES